MRANRTSRWAYLAVTLALVGAACGGGDDEGGGSTTSGATGTTAAGATTTTAQPQPGGDLIVGTIWEPFGLDPAKMIGSIIDGGEAYSIYDSLMRLDTESGEIVPFLAESLESDDLLDWTLKLRSGVTFHDGQPLDAEAMKLNMERHADPELGSRVFRSASNIESIEVVDELTLSITLKFAWPAFPESLTGNLGWPASPAAIEAGTINEHPVGTGPFAFKEWERGDHLTFVRNDSYWQEGLPYLDSITFRPIVDDITRRSSVEKGEIQLGQSLNGSELADMADKGFPTLSTEGTGISVIFNTERAPFDDVRLRMAVRYATDTETINQVMYDGVMPPPNDFRIPTDSQYVAEGVEFPSFDLDKAKELVAELEEESGKVSFTWSCYNQPDLVELTQIIEQMWEAAGMEVEVSLQDQMSYTGQALAGDYGVGCFGTTLARDPDAAYYGNFHTEGSNNNTNYSVPEVDEALDTGRTTQDVEARKEAYETVQRHLAEDLPTFIVAPTAWGWMGAENVRGGRVVPSAGLVSSGLWLEG